MIDSAPMGGTTHGRPGPALRGEIVEDTGLACPLCAAEGYRTNGGYVPELQRVADDDRPFCVGVHGWLTGDEVATAAPFTRTATR